MSKETVFSIGQVVCRKDSVQYVRINDIRMMDEVVPTFCDGGFFDTKGPFVKVGNTWVYHGQFRPLMGVEIGSTDLPPATSACSELDATDGARKS